MEGKRNIFGDGAFYRNVVKIAVPIMLQQLIQNMVSLIDNFMVSGLGDVSMSGVNVAGQILFIFMVFLNTICMSGGIFLTQFFGANDRQECSRRLYLSCLWEFLLLFLIFWLQSFPAAGLVAYAHRKYPGAVYPR